MARVTKKRTESFALPKGRWKSVPYGENEKHISIMTGKAGAREIDALVQLRLSGVPKGEQVVVRLVLARYSPAGVYLDPPVRSEESEIIGTAGTTIGQHADKLTIPAGDYRLRVQLLANADGIKVERMKTVIDWRKG